MNATKELKARLERFKEGEGIRSDVALVAAHYKTTPDAIRVALVDLVASGIVALSADGKWFHRTAKRCDEGDLIR